MAHFIPAFIYGCQQTILDKVGLEALNLRLWRLFYWTLSDDMKRKNGSWEGSILWQLEPYK